MDCAKKRKSCPKCLTPHNVNDFQSMSKAELTEVLVHSGLKERVRRTIVRRFDNGHLSAAGLARVLAGEPLEDLEVKVDDADKAAGSTGATPAAAAEEEEEDEQDDTEAESMDSHAATGDSAAVSTEAEAAEAEADDEEEGDLAEEGDEADAEEAEEEVS